VYVAFIPRKALYQITTKYPTTIIVMAGRILKALPPILRHVDFCVNLKTFQAGDTVCENGNDGQVLLNI
jgi:hypothetical protein